MRQNSHFRLPGGHRFFAKIGSYGYGTKSRWGPPGVHLGANGVLLGPKNGSKPQKITMPQNSNFRPPRDHRFFAKKWKLRLWRQIKVGTNLRLWREVTVGIPWGLSSGQWGPIGLKKMGQNRTNYHAPKLKVSTTPRSSIFPKKNGSYSCGSKSRWRLPRVHHGANGSHWVQKLGQKRRKLPCPKIRIFDYPAVIDFLQKNGSYGYGAKSRWGQIYVCGAKWRWGSRGVYLRANGVPLG